MHAATATQEPSPELEDERLDQLFHALADRTRRALLTRLAQGDAGVTALAEPFAMSLPAVSKHLRVLEGAGLVSRTVEGRVHRCALETERLWEAEQWVEEQRRFWQGSLDSLAEYVEAREDG